MGNYEIVHEMIASLVSCLLENCNEKPDPLKMILFARHVLSRTYRTECGEDMMTPIFHLTNKSQFVYNNYNRCF